MTGVCGNTIREDWKQYQAEGISQSLQKVSKSENKEGMDSLLTLKFQLFNNAYYNRG